MDQTCIQCKQAFVIGDDDLAFYEKVSPVFNGKKELLPPPDHCPACRHQIRLAFRNERKLYRRTSDATKESIMSIYSPDNPHTVYDADKWWGESWNGTNYGKEFDFNRPFFDQFKELYLSIPHIALMNIEIENSDYVNQCGWSKNCYMAIKTDFSQDCYYTESCNKTTNCVDCLGMVECELCYESVDCTNCYSVLYGHDCTNCSDCYFSSLCRGCRYCFGCSGLRNKEYCLFNKEVGKEAWEKWMKNTSFTPENIAEWKKKSEELKMKKPHPHAMMTNCEACTGNYLTNSKNAIECYDGKDIEDSKYISIVPVPLKDSQDMDGGGGELAYNCFSTGPGVMNTFCGHCWDGVHNLLYCYFCMKGSHDCFGCMGLKKQQYCILNKQYTKEEYEELVPKIIDHMRKNGEWGQFFPITMSPFGYNETVAQDEFPLTKEEVQSRGWLWRDIPDRIPQVEKVIEGIQLPANINEIPDDILNWAVRCEVTSRPYKIVKQELEFYRKMNLPVPHLHPDERHRLRMSMRNPRKLFERACDNCKKTIQTTYAPDRPEIVYCEECYLKTIY